MKRDMESVDKKEYIEREALKRDLIDNRNFYPVIVKRAIEDAPAADVVEVVRCKDCKFFIPDAELDHNEYPNIIEADGLCNGSLKFTYADDFCSCGERKEV